jgi:ubiquinone biosynthesis protein
MTDHLGRSERIRLSTDAALERWQTLCAGSMPDVSTPSGTADSVSADLVAEEGEVLIERAPMDGPAPSMARRIRFSTSRVRTLTRLLVWMWALLCYLAGNALDIVARRDDRARRARRLRRIFERMGPTFIKLGQQMSVRADVLPYEYCQEFSRMLDRVPPFDTAKAIAAIEAVTGGPISETFAEFETAPIGSGSIACVYAARLRTGERVAVKVRRPGIGEQLANELRALGWLLQVAEWIAFVKPRAMSTLHRELSSMLLGELDFHIEARNTELFRHGAAHAKHAFITAPRVYFHLSSDAVLVTEYAAGVFLHELIAALDCNDADALARFRVIDVDPRQVARNLVMVAHWEVLENLLFHADPHPANIVVQPGNKLVFIDFGSCGRLTDKTRRIWRQFYYHFSAQNVQGLVECSLAILEPLPPIDTEAFAADLEVMFWDWIHAMQSEHAEWWEKASGMMWMKFAAITRRYNVAITAEIVRIFRATFLYDTAVFRLWRQLDMSVEYRRYHREAGRRARKRVRKWLRKRLNHHLTYDDYVHVENLWRIGNQAIARVQRFLDNPQPLFGRMISKAAFGFSLILRLVAALFATYAVMIVGLVGYRVSTGETWLVGDIVRLIITNEWLQLVFVGATLIIIRKAWMRLEEVEPR